MKKVVKIMLLVLILLGTILSKLAETAQLELNPYIKAGTISWDQLSGIGGHKFLVAGGVKTNIKFDSFATTLNLEKWWVGEGLDDDAGKIPEKGYNIALSGKYFLKNEGFLVFPYAEIGFEEWQKEKGNDWKSLKLWMATVWLGVSNHKGYIQGGLSRAISVSIDNGKEPKGRYGAVAEIGIKIKKVTLGLFYKYSGVEDPDAKMVRSGLFAMYSF